MVKHTTIKDFIRDIEDGMGSNGSQENAEALVDLLLEREYFVLEWDGYYSTEKWDNMEDNEFFELWEESENLSFEKRFELEDPCSNLLCRNERNDKCESCKGARGWLFIKYLGGE